MAGELPPTRRGYDTREVVSALQKAIRRSDPDAALYWGMELVRSGFGAWLWKRLRIIAAEDCSPEATGLVGDVQTLYDQWSADQKRGDGLLFVARALIALAIAPKSRVADWGLLHHSSHHVERREVPDHALDKHTRRGRRMGRGMKHFIEEAGRLEPWTGRLDELEAEYRENVSGLATDDGASPINPWGSFPVDRKPGHNSGRSPSGQLPLGQEEDR